MVYGKIKPKYPTKSTGMFWGSLWLKRISNATHNLINPFISLVTTK